MTDSELRAERLLRRLRVEMNGAVSGAMAERGLAYKLNYGVSVPTLKAIVAEYAPDHELAQVLFRSGVREMKLAAVYVDDPARVTVEQMEEWGDDLVTTEIAEHLASGLLGKSPCMAEVAGRWLVSGDGLKEYAALMGLASALKRGTLAPGDGTLAEWVDACRILSGKDGGDVSSGIISLMREIARRSPRWRAEVAGIVKEWASGDFPRRKYIAGELEWQLA